MTVDAGWPERRPDRPPHPETVDDTTTRVERAIGRFVASPIREREYRLVLLAILMAPLISAAVGDPISTWWGSELVPLVWIIGRTVVASWAQPGDAPETR